MKRDTELPDIYSLVVCDVCGEWCHPTEVSFRYDDCEEEVVCDECRPTLRAVDGAIAPMEQVAGETRPATNA